MYMKILYLQCKTGAKSWEKNKGICIATTSDYMYSLSKYTHQYKILISNLLMTNSNNSNAFYFFTVCDKL